MYFKVLSGTPTYQKLQSLLEKMESVKNKAGSFAEKFGTKQWAQRNHFFNLVGGISAFVLDEKPKNWKKVKLADSDSGFFPSDLPSNKALIEEINSLPVVTKDELNEIVGYKEQDFIKNGKKIWSTCPGYSLGETAFLLIIDECAQYEPNDDIVEILSSEFKKLSAQ